MYCLNFKTFLPYASLALRPTLATDVFNVQNNNIKNEQAIAESCARGVGL